MSNFKKEWYKKWWGIILVVFFFPIVVPYLVWTKTNWNKSLKIIVTVICIIIGMASFFSNQAEEKAELQAEMDLIELNKKAEIEAIAYNEQAEVYISNNQIKEAVELIKKSKELFVNRSENYAFSLEEKIGELQSDYLFKRILIEMSNEELELLKQGKLQKNYIDHEDINKLFISKLGENLENRNIYIAEAETKKQEAEALKIQKQEAEETLKRLSLIEAQFSAWDGSHIKLTRLIKDSMNNPKSYDHHETVYWDMKDHIIVSATFRGENAFGGTVKNTVKAKISIDGTDIQIIEQY